MIAFMNSLIDATVQHRLPSGKDLVTSIRLSPARCREPALSDSPKEDLPFTPQLPGRIHLKSNFRISLSAIATPRPSSRSDQHSTRHARRSDFVDAGAFQPATIGFKIFLRSLILFCRGVTRPMEPGRGIPPERQLIWSGLAARCSVCSWTRVYDPNVREHRMPDEKLTEIVRAEFTDHKCQGFSSSNHSRFSVLL